MQAGVYDIHIDQGATWTLQLTWKDTSGTPINLTGYTARMQIRKDFKESTARLSLSSPSNGIVLGGSAGTIQITASKTATSGIEVDYATLFLHEGKRAQSMVYDIELESADGTATRILQGTAFVYPEVTR
jgi:hypothetical protein